MLCDDLAEYAVQRKLDSIIKSGKKKKRYQEYIDKLKCFSKNKQNIDFKSECLICGDRGKLHLQFHHLNPKMKEYDISAMKIPTLQELRKCIVLCANCHIDFHHDVRKIHVDIVNELSD